MKALYLQFAIVGSLMLIAFETGQWWEHKKNNCTQPEIAQMEHRHAGQ